MSENAEDGSPSTESNGGTELQVVLRQCNSEECSHKFCYLWFLGPVGLL